MKTKKKLHKLRLTNE